MDTKYRGFMVFIEFSEQRRARTQKTTSAIVKNLLENV